MKLQDLSQWFYEIRVEGELGDMWANWFGGLSMRTEFNEETHDKITVLYGPISDQPALYSVLNKIRDLNLKLLLIKRYEREVDVPSQDLEI